MTTDATPRSSAVVPHREWSLMSMQAEALSRSDIIPRAYQRKPANVLVAAITGRHYGWDVLTAMRNGHVIEGAWGMKPEAMLGLVRLAGHSVKGDLRADGASVTGTRSDTGDTMTIEFTIDDAVRAGLVKRDDKGNLRARSSSGKPLPWEMYPAMMCYWRAVGLLCRVLFSDLTAGVHSAEELGAPIDEDGDVLDVGDIEHTDDPQPLSGEAIAKFREACQQIDVEPGDVLALAFPEGVPDPLTEAHLIAMRNAYREVAEQKAASDESTLDRESSEQAEQVRPATKAQVGKIKGEYARLGVEDREAQLDLTQRFVGRELTTHNHLTFDEASALIERLTRLEAIDDDGHGSSNGS